MNTHPHYFANLHTVEEIKTQFRKLAMEHHPDHGGDPETMKEINCQYQAALKACDGQKKDGHSYKYMSDIEQELMNKVLELLKLRSIEIALIGYWIWVSGDTRNNKEALKTAGLQWNGNRKCWYYKPQGWKRTQRSNANLSELAAKYGYRGFATADEERLPAAT